MELWVVPRSRVHWNFKSFHYYSIKMHIRQYCFYGLSGYAAGRRTVCKHRLTKYVLFSNGNFYHYNSAVCSSVWCYSTHTSKFWCPFCQHVCASVTPRCPFPYLCAPKCKLPIYFFSSRRIFRSSSINLANNGSHCIPSHRNISCAWHMLEGLGFFSCSHKSYSTGQFVIVRQIVFVI